LEWSILPTRRPKDSFDFCDTQTGRFLKTRPARHGESRLVSVQPIAACGTITGVRSVKLGAVHLAPKLPDSNLIHHRLPPRHLLTIRLTPPKCSLLILRYSVKASYEGWAGSRFPALFLGKAAGRRGPAAEGGRGARRPREGWAIKDIPSEVTLARAGGPEVARMSPRRADGSMKAIPFEPAAAFRGRRKHNMVMFPRRASEGVRQGPLTIMTSLSLAARSRATGISIRRAGCRPPEPLLPAKRRARRAA